MQKKKLADSGNGRKLKLGYSDTIKLRECPPSILNRNEVCVWLGISERSLRNYEARGWFPVVKIGRRCLYRRDAIMHALEGMEVGGEI